MKRGPRTYAIVVMKGILHDTSVRKRQVYILQIKEVIDEQENNDVEEDEIEVCDTIQDDQLSLNAMWGTRSNQTMMIKGNCGKKKLHILIDTGSTHNFLSVRLAK